MQNVCESFAQTPYFSTFVFQYKYGRFILLLKTHIQLAFF